MKTINQVSDRPNSKGGARDLNLGPQSGRNWSSVISSSPSHESQSSPAGGALEALLEASARGDRRAFQELYESTAPRLNALLRRMPLSAADIDDVLIEAYFKVWRAAGSFDQNRGSALAWLASIARRLALDHLRAGRRRADAEGRLDAPDQESCAHSDPQELGARREQEERLQRALRDLPPDQARAVDLVFFQGCSHSQAAQQLSEPLGTIKSRIRAALRELRHHPHAPRDQ
jgi:RNA polymerase sigma-70 factor (ECF subfamily)